MARDGSSVSSLRGELGPKKSAYSPPAQRLNAFGKVITDRSTIHHTATGIKTIQEDRDEARDLSLLPSSVRE
jgi:hypothetical protein